MTLNIENINKTIATMREHAEITFDMRVWGYGHSERALGEECGTRCCLAGFAVVAKYGHMAADVNIRHEAEDYLGIDGAEGMWLFMPTDDTGAYEATLEDGIAVLTHLRDTGVVDWGIAGRATPEEA